MFKQSRRWRSEMWQFRGHSGPPLTVSGSGAELGNSY